jgi:hypothetical protein
MQNLAKLSFKYKIFDYNHILYSIIFEESLIS